MHTTDLNTQVSQYRQHLASGDIQATYAALMKFLQALRTRSAKALKGIYEVGSVFPGFMDVSYFYVTNEEFKRRKLKLGLILNHAEVRFEVWLFGQTKDVQRAFWTAFRDQEGWGAQAIMPEYAILEEILVAEPDFRDLDALSERLIAEFTKAAERLQAAVETLEV